jgi:hypothetical protein
MKRFLELFMYVLFLGFVAYAGLFSAPAQATDAPPVIITHRDCSGNAMPADMPQTLTTSASGVGSVVTIVATRGGVIWTQTIDTSASGVTAVSCASHN